MPSPIAELDRFAIFGGAPAFAEPRHVGRPNIGDRERILKLIGSALDSRWLSNDGPLVDAFEAQVAELSGAPYAIAVANATVGLQLAARALGLSGEILMPSFTFVGSAHAMSWLGLEPVFCEIGSATHVLDPVAVEQAIGPDTGAIMGVHLWGRPLDAQPLADIAAAHGLPLIFDAAHALGCTTGLGDVEVLSFHATKVANSAEGGAILTADPELAERLRRMRNFGFADFDVVRWLGTNAKMSELSAAMGVASLEHFDRFVANNRRNYELYAAELDRVEGVRLIAHDEAERPNYHYVVIEVDPELRDGLVAVLHAENVRARRYFHPGCHRHEPYRATAAELPVTEAVSARVVTLPTGGAMSPDDVVRLCGIVRVAAESAPELLRRLAR